MNRIITLTSLAFTAIVFAATSATMIAPARADPALQHYEFRCKPGSILVGVWGRTGGWIDKIGIVCRSWTGSNPLGPVHWQAAFAGRSDGGEPANAVCGDGYARAIDWQQTGAQRSVVGYAPLNFVRVNCGLFDRETNKNFPFGNHRSVSSEEGYDFTNCDSSEVPIGIRGLAGEFPHTIEFVCTSTKLHPDVLANRPGTRVGDVVAKPNVDIVANRPGTGVRDVMTPDADVVCRGKDARVGAFIPHDGFTGDWDTVTSAGIRYTMKLKQNGMRVTGEYRMQGGLVTGRIGGEFERAFLNGNPVVVSGKPVSTGWLAYRWTEGSAEGSGKFKLSEDGNSFEGWWNSGDDPSVAQNSWNGTRK